MLLHLNIRDFAIIPSLSLDFAPGFTAITGETGAGKSILVDALGLLLGQRSDASWVRQGAEKAELTAEFELAGNPAAQAWVEEAALDSDGQCLLRRSIAANGRSRAWINGTPVTVQQMAELGTLLVEIHGQNEHVLLTRPARKLALLDSSGPYAGLLGKTAQAHARWHELDYELESLRSGSALAPEEREYLGFQVRELEDHAMSPEALFALEQEHWLLSRGDAMLADLQQSRSRLEDERHGALGALHDAQRALRPHRELDPRLAEAARMLEEATIIAQEAADTVSAAAERIDLSPERLARLETQLGTLGDLARKHRVEMEDLPAVRERIQARLEASDQFAARCSALEATVAEAREDYAVAADELSGARRAHAELLSERVTGLMSQLGMQGGILRFRLSDHDKGPSRLGKDRVEIQVSANPGIEPAPLSKIASGGELSRISLAIKVASRVPGNRTTQVFDEVDAGIGGETANAVGRLLRELAGQGQALCVTHLAQVAVCASQQVQVVKATGRDQTSIDSSVLGDSERIDEIARMLGGQLSDQSRQHALEMLSAAHRDDSKAIH